MQSVRSFKIPIRILLLEKNMSSVPARSGDNVETFNQQLAKVRSSVGFIAALDQSGGSTPKALSAYGVEANEYSNDTEMFDLVHAMRTRIMTSPAFTGSRILGAILFEMTMDRQVQSLPTPDYLWQQKNVAPFLKIDKGLADEDLGVQIMKPNPDLSDLLLRARDLNVFGTKMRSVIKRASVDGIQSVVDQQFETAQLILDHHMVPIIEPEVDIHCEDKAECEAILRDALAAGLNNVAGDMPVMFKLTLPEQANFYQQFVGHPKVARVVALSGGYSREEANQRLSDNNGVVASFSRALSEGLNATQSDEVFNQTLDETIAAITQASST
ncbi:MAG: fructose-bisphosphate aldolase class I [Limisphaerales bacterium]|jgi:fructose-bisphosphate aldolase class I